MEAGALDGARAAVEALLDEKARYVQIHGLERAADKPARMAELRTAALALLDGLPDSCHKAAEYHLLRGRTLNAADSYDKAAEDALSKAIKLAPKRVAAWVALGECCWMKRAFKESRRCFEAALEAGPSKEALCALSMVLRQVDGDDRQREANIRASVDKAKEAVGLDVQDGHSWFVLGNAYLALFFAAMDSLDSLRSAMKAFKRAELDDRERLNNPDLHHNQAMIFKYQEEYSLAISGFATARQIDPSFVDPSRMLTQLDEHLTLIAETIKNKSRFKPKRLAAILESIPESADALPLLGLAPGIHSDTRVEGKVVWISSTEPIPQTFLIVDRAGTWCCLTVYNMRADVVRQEDLVSIAAPLSMPVQAKFDAADEIRFPSIRVDNPLTLKINGSAVGESKLAKSLLRIQSN